MNRPDIEAIEKRVNTATPGPWEFDEMHPLSDGAYEWAQVCTKDDSVIVAEVDDCGIAVHPASYKRTARQVIEADGEFIAHARTDVPALIVYIRELEFILEGLRK